MTSHSVTKTISLVVSDISKAKEDGLKLLEQGDLTFPFRSTVKRSQTKARVNNLVFHPPHLGNPTLHSMSLDR